MVAVPVGMDVVEVGEVVAGAVVVGEVVVGVLSLIHI